MTSDMLSQFPHPGAEAGGDAFNIAIFTLVSMLILTAIAYVIGKLLSDHRIETWAKDEFVQVMINAALVGGLFILMAPGTGLIISAFNAMVPVEAVRSPRFLIRTAD